MSKPVKKFTAPVKFQVSLENEVDGVVYKATAIAETSQEAKRLRQRRLKAMTLLFHSRDQIAKNQAELEYDAAVRLTAWRIPTSKVSNTSLAAAGLQKDPNKKHRGYIFRDEPEAPKKTEDVVKLAGASVFDSLQSDF